MLTSKKLWAAMLDGSRAQTFYELVSGRVVPFVSRASAVAGANLDPIMVRSLAARAAEKLRDHVHVLHDYTDQTLALKETMTVQMQKVLSRPCNVGERGDTEGGKGRRGGKPRRTLTICRPQVEMGGYGESVRRQRGQR